MSLVKRSMGSGKRNEPRDFGHRVNNFRMASMEQSYPMLSSTSSIPQAKIFLWFVFRNIQIRSKMLRRYSTYIQEEFYLACEQYLGFLAVSEIFIPTIFLKLLFPSLLVVCVIIVERSTNNYCCSFICILSWFCSPQTPLYLWKNILLMARTKTHFYIFSVSLVIFLFFWEGRRTFIEKIKHQRFEITFDLFKDNMSCCICTCLRRRKKIIRSGKNQLSCGTINCFLLAFKNNIPGKLVCCLRDVFY